MTEVCINVPPSISQQNTNIQSSVANPPDSPEDSEFKPTRRGSFPNTDQIDNQTSKEVNHLNLNGELTITERQSDMDVQIKDGRRASGNNSMPDFSNLYQPISNYAVFDPLFQVRFIL